MRTRLLIALTLATLIAGISVSYSATLVSSTQVGDEPRLVEVTLQSEALGRETAIRVLLPDGYASTSRSYPVLYLLHGIGDDQTKWTENTDVEGLVADRDLIVVMPDAGKNVDAGWYSDHFDGSVDWESYHIGELIPFVDATYRTVDTREGRAIAGLSMGGFGTMSYAARHPDLFATAGSFSGAVNTSDGSVAEASAFEALSPYVGTPGDGLWGPFETHEVNWRTHNPPDLSTNLEWTNLWVSTGNGVAQPGDNPASAPLEAGIYVMNVLFHDALVEDGKDHVWIDRGHGTHEWHYWEADLTGFLDFLDGHFIAPPDRPTAFNYRSAEASFDAWGWAFGVDREAQEFVDLTAVSATGMTATGSGILRVITAPIGQAGDRFEVTDSVEESATADNDGRLMFTVDLGPSHPNRQYTPEARAAELAAGAEYFTTKTVTITRLSAATPTAPQAQTSQPAAPPELPATGASAHGVILLLAVGAITVATRAGSRRRPECG